MRAVGRSKIHLAQPPASSIEPGFTPSPTAESEPASLIFPGRGRTCADEPRLGWNRRRHAALAGADALIRPALRRVRRVRAPHRWRGGTTPGGGSPRRDLRGDDGAARARGGGHRERQRSRARVPGCRRRRGSHRGDRAAGGRSGHRSGRRISPMAHAASADPRLRGARLPQTRRREDATRHREDEEE